MQAECRTQREPWAIKRGTRKYEARWLDTSGKIRAKTGFTTKSAAHKYSREQMELVAKQAQGLLEGERPKTVDELFDLFLEKHECDRATKRTLLSQLKHPRTGFGTRAPDSIRRLEIEDWCRTIPNRHYVMRAFKQAFKWAHDRGLCNTNPTAGIKNPKPKHGERREKHPFAAWDEVEAVAAEIDARYSAIPIVLVGTGLRPEELFGLHRSDVDWERRRLHVQRRYSDRTVKSGGKTGESRHVPFGDRVEAALRSLPVRLDTPILFPAARGGYIELESFRHRQWTPAVRAAGIGHRTLYDCRHTYASWALTAVPPAKLAKIMGTSIHQLDDTYHHLMPTDDEFGSVVDTYGMVVEK